MLNDRIDSENKLEPLRKEAVMTYLKATSYNLIGAIEEKHE